MLKVKFAVDQVMEKGRGTGWQNVLLVKVGSKGNWEEVARHPEARSYEGAQAFEEEDVVEILARLSARV